MRRDKSVIFDLLKNEHFVRWVQHPTDESNHYWTKWIFNHGANKKDVEVARRIIQSGSLKIRRSLSEENYDRMLENIMDYVRQKHTIQPSGHFNLRIYGAIAAAVAVIALSTVFFIGKDSQPSETNFGVPILTKEAPNGSKLTTRLPDGTMVTLNSGSTLSFPDEFQGSLREVRLSGEAFFEVEHNPSKPFLVHFRNQHVKVLGTSFNIRSYQGENQTEVAVATGKVSYSHSKGEPLILVQNEMASHSNKTSRVERREVNGMGVFGWRDRILYFEDDTFEDIKSEIERWFGVTISIPGKFEPTGTYSGTFENASIKEVLTGLSFIYRFDFKIEGSKVTIAKQH